MAKETYSHGKRDLLTLQLASAGSVAVERARRTAPGAHAAFVRHLPRAQTEGPGAASAGGEVDEFAGLF